MRRFSFSLALFCGLLARGGASVGDDATVPRDFPPAQGSWEGRGSPPRDRDRPGNRPGDGRRGDGQWGEGQWGRGGNRPGGRPDRRHDHHHHLPQPPTFWYFGTFPLPWPAYSPAFPGYLNPFAPQTDPVIAAPAADPPQPDVDEPEPQRRAIRASNEQQLARAGKFIAHGDTNFGKQKYLAAAERYRTATETAPDLADAYVRHANALVALGQYESACRAFRRALRLRPDWTDAAFRLDQVYGADQIAKVAHFEELAQAVEANPLDAKLLIALGMQLYFDGQQERAKLFFARADQLGGNEDQLLNGFLGKPLPAVDGQPAEAERIVF